MRVSVGGVSDVGVEVVLVCVDIRSEQASRIHGIDGDVGVGKRPRRSFDIGGEVFPGVVCPLQVKLVVAEGNGKAGGNPHQILAALSGAKVIGNGD